MSFPYPYRFAIVCHSRCRSTPGSPIRLAVQRRLPLVAGLRHNWERQEKE